MIINNGAMAPIDRGYMIPPHYFFYRATICQRGTRSGPVSICLSVWHAVCLDSRRYCIEVAKHGIMQSTLYDSSETLVFFWSQDLDEIPMGHPSTGGVSKMSNFRPISRLYSRTGTR